MKFHRILSYSALAASLLLASCASKFTPAQRAGLATVAVAQTEVYPDAYEEPYGGDVQARNAASNVQGAGILGPLVGMAVGGAISGTQNANFKGHNKGYFAAVQKNAPGDLGTVLNKKLKESLKADPFFRNRLTPSSGNLVNSKITSYRLLRTGKNDDGELLFTPEIYTEIQLKDVAGKTLAGKTYVGTGFSGHLISEYASSPTLEKEVFTAAANNAVIGFMADLAIKTAE